MSWVKLKCDEMWEDSVRSFKKREIGGLVDRLINYCGRYMEGYVFVHIDWQLEIDIWVQKETVKEKERKERDKFCAQ